MLPGGRWLRISLSDSREGGFVAICGDITVEKQREAALVHTNLLFDAALSKMSQGLCLYAQRPAVAGLELGSSPGCMNWRRTRSVPA